MVAITNNESTMNQQWIAHGTCRVGDDTLMVVGGWTGQAHLNSVEVLKL